MDVLEKIRAANEKYRLFEAGEVVLVAVSGGPDSVALLYALHELREEFRIRLEVAHVEHGIRGEDGSEDARFVERITAGLKIPFHWKAIDLPALKSAAGKGNLEALGREARYDFFTATGAERSIRKIATAHTRDDQAETLLMRVLRGSGRSGLRGIRPVSRYFSAGTSFTIVRPVLDCSKSELIQFLSDKRRSYRLDRTNQDIKLLRNWVRHDLLPRLQENIDQRLPVRLAREAEILGDEDDLLDAIARDALTTSRAGEALQRDRLIEHPKPILRRVLRLWLHERRGTLRGIALEHIEGFARLILEGPPHARLPIPGGWELVKQYDTFILERGKVGPNRVGYSYPLAIGGKLLLAEAEMAIESEEIDPPVSSPRTLWEAIFDSAELAEPLTVRTFRHGDRFQPLGMAGHKKLKDLFIEKKVPLSRRPGLPIVCSGAEVLWIPGYGRSDLAKVGPRTRKILRLNAFDDGKLSSNFSD